LFGLSDEFEKDYYDEPRYDNQTKKLQFNETYIYSRVSPDK